MTDDVKLDNLAILDKVAILSKLTPADRQGLLRDTSEVFAKEKMNLIGVQTQSLKSTAWMTFTVEVADAIKLQRALAMVRELEGVRSARRR